VKCAVDDAIDQCSAVLNLCNAIKDSRVHAEEATEERHIPLHVER
jgi:hypothetical protein